MSGYRDCACRNCFEIAIGEEGALCWACEEAECSNKGDQDCQVEPEPEDEEEET